MTWLEAPERYCRSAERREGITVAGVPDDWALLRVINTDTNQPVMHVIEVDCDEGWVRQHIYEDGKAVIEGMNGGAHIKAERTTGNFRIEREEE